jgi:PAS domain S-box-containing protein
MRTSHRSSEELLAEIAELRSRLEQAEAALAERVRAEEALRDDHERLHKVFEIQTVGVMFWDLTTGRMTDANDTFLKTMGYSRAEVEGGGLTWQKLTPPEYFELSQAEVIKFQASGLIGPYEKEYFRKDGTRQWFVFAGSSLGNNSCVEFCVDISERKQVEQALRESEEQFTVLIQNLQSAVALIDEHGAFNIVNNSFLSMFHIPQGTDILNINSRDWSQWQVFDEDGELLDVEEHPVRKAALTGAAVQNQLVAVKSPSGPDLKWLLVSAAPILNEGKGLHRVICTYYDITAHKEAENALKRLNETLEQNVAERTAELREKDQILLAQGRQAAMGEMIGNIAHQWRQPLNNLGLMLQKLAMHQEMGLLNDDLLSESVDSSMLIIKHMSNTIDDFRNFFKPDKERGVFGLREAVSSSLSLIADRLSSLNIAVVLETEQEVRVTGYQNEFAQALLNILNNAADALTEVRDGDARIWICIGARDGRPFLSIRDNAGGIPVEIIGKVFDPYFSTKGPQQGTGIGLFMANNIIEKNMGGKLTVTNTADGADFRIEF